MEDLQRKKEFRGPLKIRPQRKVPAGILKSIEYLGIWRKDHTQQRYKVRAQVHRDNQRALHGHVLDHDELIDCVDAPGFRQTLHFWSAPLLIGPTLIHLQGPLERIPISTGMGWMG